MAREAQCPTHGLQGIGLVCTHVAHAIDSGQQVGFFWGDDTDVARPDAWCADCERNLVALQGTDSSEWFEAGEFKILCAVCWDEAKWMLFEQHQRGRESSE